MQSINMPYDLSFIHSYNWKDPSSDVQKALDVINCNSDHHDSDCLATGEDYREVSRLLASNPDTPAAVLDHMSSHLKHEQLLERVASNSNAQQETLKRLARHDSPDVRRAVAESPRLDDEILQLLASDPHTDVRFTLAENHSVPLRTLEELSNDDNPYVAHRADMTRRRLINSKLRAPEQLPKNPNKGIRRVV